MNSEISLSAKKEKNKDHLSELENLENKEHVLWRFWYEII